MTLPRRSFLKSIAAVVAGITAVKAVTAQVVEPTTVDVPEWGVKVGVRTETDEDRAWREQFLRNQREQLHRGVRGRGDKIAASALVTDDLVACCKSYRELKYSVCDRLHHAIAREASVRWGASARYATDLRVDVHQLDTGPCQQFTMTATRLDSPITTLPDGWRQTWSDA